MSRSCISIKKKNENILNKDNKAYSYYFLR